MAEDNQASNPPSPASPAPAATSIPSAVPNSHPSPENGSYCLPARTWNHKEGCNCLSCQRTQARRAAGKPTVAEEQAARDARKAAKLAAKEARKKAAKKGNLTSIAVQSSIETQSALKHKVDYGVTAKVVGITPERVGQIAREGNFVNIALSNAGIDDAFLAELAKEGMGAFTQKIITDNDGNIIDVVNIPIRK